nr:hypothetical protein CFP56_44464 [Quercus suber]
MTMGDCQLGEAGDGSTFLLFTRNTGFARSLDELVAGQAITEHTTRFAAQCLEMRILSSDCEAKAHNFSQGYGKDKGKSA